MGLRHLFAVALFAVVLDTVLYHPEASSEPRDRSAAGPGAAGDAPALAPPRAARRPNLVLVFVDTLRADHVGSYGYARPTTPRLDRFAAGAVQFDHVHAQAP